MKFIDLHVHSNISDGTFTPSQLVQYGIEKNLSALALTDHDSMDGLAEAIAASRGTPIQIINGIELSTSYMDKDIHILGLFVNPDDKVFQKKIIALQDTRYIRNEKMIRNLQKAGFDISMEKITKDFGEPQITRAHMARYLFDHAYVKNIEEAFKKYLNDKSPYFVSREKLTPIQAINLLLDNKAIPILAHPLLYRFNKQELEALVKNLKASGLVGLEAVYSENSLADEGNMKRLAKKYDLLISGGSDFHGSNKPHLDLGSGRGNLRISEDILNTLKEYKG